MDLSCIRRVALLAEVDAGAAQDPRHFYLYLEGRNLGASSAAGKRFAAEALMIMTAVAAASFAVFMA